MMFVLGEEPSTFARPSSGAFAQTDWDVGSRRRQWVAYVCALTLTGAVIAAHVVLSPHIGASPALNLILVPVIISGYLGGLGPGLLSTGLGALGADYFLLAPLHSLWIAGSLERARWAGLVVTGCLISFVCEALHREIIRTRDTEKKLRTISLCNQVLVRARDERELAESVCECLVEAGGYRMAWVGYAEQDEAKTIRAVAHAGYEEGYLGLAPVTWGENEYGHGPSGAAFRSGQPVVNRDTHRNEAMEPWRIEAVKRGYASSIALPLRSGSQMLGILALYALNPDAFDGPEVALLSELAADLGFGIEAIRARAARHRVEEDLLFKTALLEAQSETTIDGILVVDRASQIVLANRRFYDLWEVPAQLTGTRDDKQLLDWVVDKVKDPETFLEKVSYLYDHEEEQSYDEIVLKDDRVFERHSSSLQDSRGKRYGRIWYFRDITIRKHAEAERVRLVTAIEQSDEAVVITDITGKIEYVNPAFTWITGYSREEALGQNPSILKSNMHEPLFYRELWTTILGGRTWKGELCNRRKDGKIYTEQMAITPVRDRRGTITHFIATKQDVTDLKSLEQQLHQTSKIEAIGRLAGGVAHDFNNLLTIINGYSELLIDALASDRAAINYLKEVKNAGERAASLTRAAPGI